MITKDPFFSNITPTISVSAYLSTLAKGNLYVFWQYRACRHPLQFAFNYKTNLANDLHKYFH